MLARDKANPEAIYVQGLCLYYQDKVEEAFEYFDNVLKLVPEHSKTLDVLNKARLLQKKRQEANDAFNNEKYSDAYTLYSEALKIDPQNSTINALMYYNRSIILGKQNKIKESIEDLTAAIILDSNFMNARLKRARFNADLGNWDKVIQDYKEIRDIEIEEEKRLKALKSKKDDEDKAKGRGDEAMSTN